jgi:outer membrane biosynthesis protein TonB
MNRIITILVTIFILLLLYIWISHVWGSDKPRHPRQIVDAKETGMSDDMTGTADTSMTAYNSIPPDTTTQEPLTDDEFATERKTEVAEEVKTEPAKTEPVAEKKVTETKKPEPKPAAATPKKATPTPAPASKPVSTPPKTETKPTMSSTATDEQHLVIAGNFTLLENAQQRLQELKKAGYKDAEIVNFDLSEYHTVCAGRFSDVNEARKLVKKLKDYNKIDAYVRIGG